MVTTKVLLQYADWALVVACVAALVAMVRKGLARQFPTLAALLAMRALIMLFTISILFHRKAMGLSIDRAYKIYFYGDWAASAVLLILEVATIYAVYRLVMKPLEGLQRIGTVIFRWVSSVSLTLALVMAFGPHMGGTAYLASLLGRVEEGVSVLVLCLLLFVCFAARPLGLTYRSRVFGITLGMGITGCTSLVLSAWLSTTVARTVYSPVYLAGAIGSIVAMCTMTAYFVLPEPARKMILLPTTSPYFLWNRISEALGDEPGVVAVAGFTPSMLASAEMAAIKAISTGSRKAMLTEDSMPMPQPLALSR